MRPRQAANVAMPIFKKYELTQTDCQRLGVGPHSHPESRVRDHPKLGSYTLIEAIECQSPDECYHAWPHGKSGSASPRFIRTFPYVVFTDSMRDWLRLQVERIDYTDYMGSKLPGIERIFELDIVGDRGVIISEYIFGASIADIRPAFIDRPLSWSITLALFAAVLARVLRLHAKGVCHGGVTAGLIRLDVNGEVWLCRGLPHALQSLAEASRPGPDSMSRHWRDNDLIAVGRAVFPLAAGGRARQVAELFSGRDRQAFAVLSDLIIETDPAITDLAITVLRPLEEPSLSEAEKTITAGQVEALMHRALDHVSPGEVRRLLETVVARSPDFQRTHRALGR